MGFPHPARLAVPPDCSTRLSVRKPTSGAVMPSFSCTALGPKAIFQPMCLSPAAMRSRRNAHIASMPR